MKKTFIFEMKRLFLPASIYLGFMIILGAIWLFSFNYLPDYCYTNLFTTFMFMLILGLVILSFSYNKKRISADMTYALPVTKRQLFFGKYLANLALIVILGLIYFVIVLILVALTKYKSYSENVLVGNVIAGCFLLIGLAIPLYNFILLFYYKANTIFDGILFVILGTAVCILILLPLKQLTEDYNIGVSPIDFYFNIVEFVFENNMTPWNIMMLVGYILFGLAIVGYLYWFSKKDCSIRTNEKCEGVFGYKVLLPLLNLGILMFILMPYGIKEFRVEYFLLITLGMFIFFGIYNRSPKFSKSSYIEFGVMTGINLLLVLIAVLS